MNLFSSVLLLALSCAAIGNSAWAGCPGPESTLTKDDFLVASLPPSAHAVDRYFDYPWVWDDCYQEYEDGDFDAYDEVKAIGPVMEYQNCGEGTSNGTTTVATSVSVTVSLSGGSEETIAAELGWATLGQLKFGSGSSFNWEVSGTFSGSAELEVSGVSPDTHKYFWPYVRYKHRKGGEYKYVLGTVKNWCTSHAEWEASYSDQVDYYSLSSAETTFVGGHGVREDDCTPCNCQMNWTGSTVPVTLPSPYSFTAGANWYND